MKVLWSNDALADLREIDTYLAEQDGYDAVVRRIEAAAERLGEFPAVGAPIVGTDLRKLSVWPYTLRYRVGPRVVRIISVRHGRRGPA